MRLRSGWNTNPTTDAKTIGVMETLDGCVGAEEYRLRTHTKIYNAVEPFAYKIRTKRSHGARLSFTDMMASLSGKCFVEPRRPSHLSRPLRSRIARLIPQVYAAELPQRISSTLVV